MQSIRTILLGAAVVALAACGGTQKKGTASVGGDDGDGPAAPALSEFTKEEPKREISSDARKDYEAAAAFYKDKTVRIVVGVAVGSGYDINARALARHLGAHIPGNPQVIV